LRIEAACSAPTEIEVLVRAAGAELFNRRNPVRTELGPERAAAVLRLPAVGARFEVLVRSPAASELTLRALEVRRAPLPGS